jgi:hypothetical protein
MRSGRRGLGKRVGLVCEMMSLEDGWCGNCVYLFSSLLCGCLLLCILEVMKVTKLIFVVSPALVDCFAINIRSLSRDGCYTVYSSPLINQLLLRSELWEFETVKLIRTYSYLQLFCLRSAREHAAYSLFMPVLSEFIWTSK